MEKPKITPEEADLLSQETELLAKKEQGQNLEANEIETLSEITTLQGELAERFKGEENPVESKDLQSALAQKDHFRTKAKKAGEDLEDYKKENPLKGAPPKEDKKSEDAEIWKASEDPMEVVKLGKVLKDYSEEETEFIMKNAPTKDIEGIVKATENPMVQAAIQGMRDKAEKLSKTPPPSSPDGSTPVFDAPKAVKEGTEIDEIAKRYKEVDSGEKREGV